MKHGKKYRSVVKKIDQETKYSLEDAIKLATETSTTKFDATVEVHMHLGIDPKQSDQQIRNIVVLPHGTGKKITIAAFVADDDVKKTLSAGADFAGEDDLIDKVNKGWTDFDIAIATPEMMKKLAKVARILGQKRLMPNPKAGTVTNDIEKTIEELKKGRIEYRNDSLSGIHSVIGKVSFGTSKLIENAKTLFESIKSAKPAKLKGTYIKKVFLTTSMGPSIQVNVNDI